MQQNCTQLCERVGAATTLYELYRNGADCAQQSGGAPWWVECRADTHSLERFSSSISERLWALSGL